MKILFYDTKSYDKESFEATLAKYPGIQIDYIRSDLDPRTAALADGFDAVCACLLYTSPSPRDCS